MSTEQPMGPDDIKVIHDRIHEQSVFVEQLLSEAGKVIVGQKYMLERLDKNMVQQALDRNMGKVDHVILDWKGLGKEKKRISDLLKELNIEFKRTKDY